MAFSATLKLEEESRDWAWIAEDVASKAADRSNVEYFTR